VLFEITISFLFLDYFIIKENNNQTSLNQDDFESTLELFEIVQNIKLPSVQNSSSSLKASTTSSMVQNLNNSNEDYSRYELFSGRMLQRLDEVISDNVVIVDGVNDDEMHFVEKLRNNSLVFLMKQDLICLSLEELASIISNKGFSSVANALFR
jgi:hypothetical protein